MSKQTIRKSKPKNKYMSLPNKTARNIDLSYEALGMLVYIQSLPENWILHVSTLPRVGCGRDKAYRIISELLEKGYAKRTKVLNKKRQVVCVEYEISDNPDFLGESESTRIADEPLTENPYTENPDTDEPYTENKELQRKDSSKKVVEKETKDIPIKKSDADILASLFNVIPQTPKDWKFWGNIVKDLKAAGILSSEYTTYLSWIKKQSAAQGNWTVTATSLTNNSRPSLYISEKENKAQKPARANLAYDFTPDYRSEDEIRAAMERGES